MGGTRGARAIAGLLAAEGTQLEYVLDEGSPLLADGLAPFMTDRAVALVGTAEKVRASLIRHAKATPVLQLEFTGKSFRPGTFRHARAGGLPYLHMLGGGPNIVIAVSSCTEHFSAGTPDMQLEERILEG